MMYLVLFNQILLGFLALLSLLLAIHTPDRFMRWVFAVTCLASACTIPFISRILA